MDADERSLVRVAVAACVACCAAPIVAALLGVGVAGLLSTALLGMVGAAVAGAAALALVVARRRRQACCAPSSEQKAPVPLRRATDKPRIPLFDDSAPVACTIGTHEISDRVALLERMRSDLRRIDAGEHGLVLRFPARPDIAADVRRFAVDEKRCCEFWGFEITEDAEEVTLRWDSPPGARDLLDGIEAYLRGDEPVSSLSGLL